MLYTFDNSSGIGKDVGWHASLASASGGSERGVCGDECADPIDKISNSRKGRRVPNDGILTFVRLPITESKTRNNNAIRARVCSF